MSKGGFRIGSGRKPKKDGKADMRVTFRITKEMYNFINAYAQKENLSVGQYVRKIAISNLRDNN